MFWIKVSWRQRQNRGQEVCQYKCHIIVQQAYPEGGKLLGGCRATAPAPPPLSAFSWSLKLLVSLPVGSEPCPESGESLAAESWVPGLGPTMLGLGPPMGGLPRLPGGDFHIAGWVNDPPDEPLAPNIFASDLVGAGLVVLLESRGDRCRMNCTSWLYSPHLASTCKQFFLVCE